MQALAALLTDAALAGQCELAGLFFLFCQWRLARHLIDFRCDVGHHFLEARLRVHVLQQGINQRPTILQPAGSDCLLKPVIKFCLLAARCLDACQIMARPAPLIPCGDSRLAVRGKSIEPPAGLLLPPGLQSDRRERQRLKCRITRDGFVETTHGLLIILLQQRRQTQNSELMRRDRENIHPDGFGGLRLSFLQAELSQALTTPEIIRRQFHGLLEPFPGIDLVNQAHIGQANDARRTC